MVTGTYRPELARESAGLSGRIEGYDAARALAIFGMIVVNFKIVMGSGASGPRWLVALAGLFEGRAAALFVLLAGVGLSLLARRALLAGPGPERRRARSRVWRRALALLVAGLLLTPIWPADILHFYGLYLALGGAMLFASDRALLLAAAGLLAGFAVLFGLFDYGAGWNWATLEYGDLWTGRGIVRNLLFNGFHPLFPWGAF
ncbi:MAG TPA: heparan-alpha-glucosaminide N-acetyltransferase domain-containing protein, partial [Herpetosiphonaceae bacterium]|nr:heparan-alpha-glucosaminide N-acetyltransferase domain-containing protein [Herpetosiphonaceae bacterium]